MDIKEINENTEIDEKSNSLEYNKNNNISKDINKANNDNFIDWKSISLSNEIKKWIKWWEDNIKK